MLDLRDGIGSGVAVSDAPAAPAAFADLSAGIKDNIGNTGSITAGGENSTTYTNICTTFGGDAADAQKLYDGRDNFLIRFRYGYPGYGNFVSEYFRISALTDYWVQSWSSQGAFVQHYRIRLDMRSDGFIRVRGSLNNHDIWDPINWTYQYNIFLWDIQISEIVSITTPAILPIGDLSAGVKDAIGTAGTYTPVQAGQENSTTYVNLCTAFGGDAADAQKLYDGRDGYMIRFQYGRLSSADIYTTDYMRLSVLADQWFESWSRGVTVTQHFRIRVDMRSDGSIRVRGSSGGSVGPLLWEYDRTLFIYDIQVAELAAT